MNKITDYGARGAEHITEYTKPETPEIDSVLEAHINIVKQFPRIRLEEDAADGAKKPIDTFVLPLSNDKTFRLVHSLANYSPLVYISPEGGPASMGILSPNYNNHGHKRNPDIKVIPLFTPYPLIQKGQFDLVPDARMMTMLAGAANSEAKGVGGHGNVDKDFEHKATILGAISIGNHSVAINHDNHEIRKQDGSVASNLTNGRLGNLYTPNQSEHDFTGFGPPIVIKANQPNTKSKLYIPESFLGNEEAFGVTYDDADRIMLGAGMQALHNRQAQTDAGRSIISDQIKMIGKQVKLGAH